MDDIKTEDIINNLRTCSYGFCEDCSLDRSCECIDLLMQDAADRLEELNNLVADDVN